MKFDVKPHVTFLCPTWSETDGGDKIIAMGQQIHKIYLGYRQCYSKDPWHKPTITAEHAAELKEAFIAYQKFLRNKLPQLKDETFLVELEENSCELEEVKILDHLNLYFNYLCSKYGEVEFLMYLHKCAFIKKHMMHTSPLEHGTLTVQISGVSRVFSHQWTRARIATHSQQSTRYVAEDPEHMEFITPPSVAADPEAMEAVKGYLEHLGTLMKTLADRGITREDIRMYYPHCIPTQIVTTMNFHNWMHTLGERCCSRTSYEIRYVAKAVQEFLMKQVPFVFENLGPKCEALGYCPEHKGCGHMPSKDQFEKS